MRQPERGSGEHDDRVRLLNRILMDAIPCSVLVIDRRLRVVVANRNFLDRARRTAGDTVGKPVSAVLPEAILEGAGLARHLRRVLEAGEEVRGLRLTYRAPGVTERIYYLSVLPVGDGDEPEHALLVMEDVTEQVRLGAEVREAEHHLARVVENASDLVISTDAQGRILSWNDPARRLTGKTADQVSGRPFEEHVAAEGAQAWNDALDRLLAGEATVRAEWPLCVGDGPDLPVSWVCSCIRDETGAPQAAVLVGRDLSERRQLELQILQGQRLAALGIMAGGIAHEIRNPLSVALSACVFLQEEPQLAPFARECVERIEGGIQRACDAINKLVQFSRPTDRDLTTFELVDLGALVDETLPLMRNELRRGPTEVRVSRPQGTLLVSGKAAILQQVLINLLLNAVKAMPHKGLVELSLARKQDQVLLTVRDHGVGIPAADLGRIFDPYYTTRGPGEGMGLGLSFCYNAVKNHFGHLHVTSTEGKGTCVEIRLPAA